MSDSLLRSKQVTPLPVVSGGANATNQSLIDTHTKLTMLGAQSIANAKYDPPTPQFVTQQVIIEKFSNGTLSTSLFVLGGLFIVYGLVTK